VNPHLSIPPPSYDGRMPVATPLSAAPEQLAAIRYNADGVVPAIIQEHASRTVLMMGWMNEAALLESLTTGRTVFWSRSRRERWRKGDTSGDRQWIREAYYDCDGDTLLFLVEQEGRGACHTGEYTCFYRSLGVPAEHGADAPAPAVGDTRGGAGVGNLAERR
jgi:phosphoribosyl-AMP cyclohydrolase